MRACPNVAVFVCLASQTDSVSFSDTAWYRMILNTPAWLPNRFANVLTMRTHLLDVLPVACDGGCLACLPGSALQHCEQY